MADTRKQEEKRELILEWYKLLKPFHCDGAHARLVALADDMSRNAIHSIVWPFIFLGGVWTVILVLIYLFGGREQRELLLWLGPASACCAGHPGIIAAIPAAARAPTDA
jgi:hypothetical protein